MRKFLGVLLVMLFTLVMCGTALAAEGDLRISPDVFPTAWTNGESYGPVTFFVEIEDDDENFDLSPHTYTWEFEGTPPEDLIIGEHTGVLSGILDDTPGSFSFTIKATSADDVPEDVEKPVTFTLNAELVITNSSQLTDGFVGVTYSVAFTKTGGTGAVTWARDSGTLPNGLTLTDNVLSGTPTVAGEFTFEIKVTDSIGAFGLKEFTIEIDEHFRIDATGLETGNRLEVGEEADFELVTVGENIVISTITWTVTNGTALEIDGGAPTPGDKVTEITVNALAPGKSKVQAVVVYTKDGGSSVTRTFSSVEVSVYKPATEAATEEAADEIIEGLAAKFNITPEELEDEVSYSVTDNLITATVKWSFEELVNNGGFALLPKTLGGLTVPEPEIIGDVPGCAVETGPTGDPDFSNWWILVFDSDFVGGEIDLRMVLGNESPSGGLEPGTEIEMKFLFAEKEGGNPSSSGCDAGFGFLALALLGSIPLVLRRK